MDTLYFDSDRFGRKLCAASCAAQKIG